VKKADFIYACGLLILSGGLFAFQNLISVFPKRNNLGGDGMEDGHRRCGSKVKTIHPAPFEQESHQQAQGMLN